MGEAGELAECFQWRGEVACGLPDFTPQERHHVGESRLLPLIIPLLLADAGKPRTAARPVQGKREPTKHPHDTPHLRAGEELSDVLLYLIRLADACGINLAEAALQKMQRNAAKYPADRCRGSSAKYTRYEQQQQQQAAPQPGNTAQQQPSAAVAAAGAGQPAAEPGQQHPAALQS